MTLRLLLGGSIEESAGGIIPIKISLYRLRRRLAQVERYRGGQERILGIYILKKCLLIRLGKLRIITSLVRVNRR